MNALSQAPNEWRDDAVGVRVGRRQSGRRTSRADTSVVSGRTRPSLRRPAPVQRRNETRRRAAPRSGRARRYAPPPSEGAHSRYVIDGIRRRHGRRSAVALVPAGCRDTGATAPRRVGVNAPELRQQNAAVVRWATTTGIEHVRDDAGRTATGCALLPDDFRALGVTRRRSTTRRRPPDACSDFAHGSAKRPMDPDGLCSRPRFLRRVFDDVDGAATRCPAWRPSHRSRRNGGRRSRAFSV